MTCGRGHEAGASAQCTFHGLLRPACEPKRRSAGCRIRYLSLLLILLLLILLLLLLLL